MKVIALAICSKPTTTPTVEETQVQLLKEEYDLSDVTFFARGNSKELIRVGMLIKLFTKHLLIHNFFL